MGKVWVKTRYDNDMQWDIPHSVNIATAMMGFRELGATLVPYHTIDEIYDAVSADDIVLDYIQQCGEIFAKFGVYPSIPDYPAVMKPFLGRKIWKDTMNHIASDETLWSAGNFVKPVESKVFTGKCIHSIADLVGCGNSEADVEVFVSEPLDIVAEWRGFIRYDTLIDVRSYGSIAYLAYEGYRYHYDMATLDAMMAAFRQWDARPAACSLDICVTKEGRTLLVEMNDVYALGCYGLPALLYARLISARWSELLAREDCYR